MRGVIDCCGNICAGTACADFYRPASDACELGDSTRLGDFTHRRSERIESARAGKAVIDVTREQPRRHLSPRHGRYEDAIHAL
jgi:hypothetical protein